MQALVGAGMGRRKSFHPQACLKLCLISGLRLLLAQSHADGVRPPAWGRGRGIHAPGAARAQAPPTTRFLFCCLFR